MTPPINTTPRQIAALAKALAEKLESVRHECESLELEGVHEAYELSLILASLTQEYRFSQPARSSDNP